MARRARDARSGTLLNLALIGFLMVGVGNLSVVWAEQWVPSGMAALFVATAPFWMAILEAFRKDGERLDVRGALGMLIGFAGVGPAGDAEAQRLTDRYAFHPRRDRDSDRLVRMAARLGPRKVRDQACAAAHVRRASDAVGGIVTGIVGFSIGEASRFALTPRTLAAAAYLTVFGSIIAYSAYVYALAHMRTTHMSLYAYINPLVAVILGWLILNERLTIVSVIAMVVILAGVALVQTSRNRTVAAASNQIVVEESAA